MDVQAIKDIDDPARPYPGEFRINPSNGKHYQWLGNGWAEFDVNTGMPVDPLSIKGLKKANG